jgi:hypothetical protein
MAGCDDLSCMGTVATRTDFEAALGQYGRAAEEFGASLGQAETCYDLMVAKQRFLQAAAEVIKKTSLLLDCREISLAATIFEAAAWAYLDHSDMQAFHQGLDNRFTLLEEDERFLRSRLKVRADEARRIRRLYERELAAAESLQISALRFLLDLVLELPIGAWECAACLAFKGRCAECGYGQDHAICSRPGSTYEMLNRSHEAMLGIIRRDLAVMKMRFRDRRPLEEKFRRLDWSDRLTMLQLEVDICGGYDLVRECD